MLGEKEVPTDTVDTGVFIYIRRINFLENRGYVYFRKNKKTGEKIKLSKEKFGLEIEKAWDDYKKKRQGRIKSERMDHLEKGAHIGKPREQITKDSVIQKLRFEKKSKPSDVWVWDKKGITPKFCPDYSSFIFSKRCRLEKECKNAKKMRHTLINSNTKEVSVSLYTIRCNGRLFVCKICKKEFMDWGEAATCYHNHEIKLK